MKIETKFDIGDVIFAIAQKYPTDDWQIHGPMTIGRVSVSITDSVGRDGEEVFDNYKPQKELVEQYMCVETGIGTGYVYEKSKLFKSRMSADHAIAMIKDSTPETLTQ